MGKSKKTVNTPEKSAVKGCATNKIEAPKSPIEIETQGTAPLLTGNFGPGTQAFKEAQAKAKAEAEKAKAEQVKSVGYCVAMKAKVQEEAKVEAEKAKAQNKKCT